MKSRNIYHNYVKRVIDIVISLCAIIILAPLFVVLTWMVKSKIGKPILFVQERPGYREKIFRLYKFRTMTDERDENGELLADEKRLTHFGRWLRSTSLDELPQLFNILKGDMSLIGPRALLIKYLPRYSIEQHRRHNVRPGLVGLAALHGRNNQSWDDKFKWDIYYVDNISLWLDIKIFFGAIKVTLSKEGVTEENQATMSEFLGNSEVD